MDCKTEAVVLCAGIGSRIALPPGLNKCAVPINGTSPVRHMVSALLKAGVDGVALVVGYAPDTVEKALEAYRGDGRVRFVQNPHFNRHGCNYSLACGMADPLVEKAERVMIAEGDSLLHSDSVFQLIRCPEKTASLVRHAKYVDYRRSVVAVGRREEILRYTYDTAHTGRAPAYADGETVIGESMQLWSVSGQALKKLKRLLKEYRTEADRGSIPCVHSGVHSINLLHTDFAPVFSDRPEDWINLNTQEDLRNAGNAEWLIK